MHVVTSMHETDVIVVLVSGCSICTVVCFTGQTLDNGLILVSVDVVSDYTSFNFSQLT